MRPRPIASVVGLALTLNTATAAERHPGAPAGSAEQDSASQLPALTVTARPLSGYNVLDASTATKTDTPIMETPVSIQVVPKAVLDDQQAIDLEDAVKNVSGVAPQFSFGYREGFLIRGFVAQTNHSRDSRDGSASTSRTCSTRSILPRPSTGTMSCWRTADLSGASAGEFLVVGGAVALAEC